MRITIDTIDKQFDNIKQVLFELAFCHYPVKITLDDKEYIFDEFSKAEEFLKGKE